MDWLTFIVEIVKALAWPALLFFAVLVFRKPLLVLLPGLQRLSIKNIEVEFSRELLQVEKRIPAADRTVPDRLRQIAAVAPTAAIVEAWRDLEAAAADAAARQGISVTGGTWQIFTALRAAGVLNDDQASAIETLRKLRNKVVHASDAEVTEDQALRYIESAAALANALRRAS